MPILCCQPKPEQIIDHRFQQTIENDVDIEPCLLHRKKVEFVCTQKQCQHNNNTLLCHQCLKEHRNHDWKTREQYFTKSFRSIVHKNLNVHLRETLDEMEQAFTKQMEVSVVGLFNKELAEVNQIFGESLREAELQYEQRIERKKSKKNISIDNFQELKGIYNEEKEEIRKIEDISDILRNSLKHLGKSIHRMMEMLKIQVQAKTWNNRQTMEKFQNEIESYDMKSKVIEEEKNYFYFTPNLRHENIKLQSDRIAVYQYSMPSKPVAMTQNSLVVNHNKFGFQILKMDSKAFFFQCTTIFIGICNQETVKIAGMRRINEMSKGSYLISSAGWSYHNKDQRYNRMDNVGWTFGEDDKIEVQVVFDKHVESTDNSKIIFTKKGRFFDSTFEMPLKLKNQELRKLKPCVSFDADTGAKVKIYDIQ